MVSIGKTQKKMQWVFIPKGRFEWKCISDTEERCREWVDRCRNDTSAYLAKYFAEGEIKQVEIEYTSAPF